MMKILNKPVEVVATSNVMSYFGPEVNILNNVLTIALGTNPYDMFVLEEKNGVVQVRVAGYHLKDNTLEEKKIVAHLNLKWSFPFKTVWFKLDDQGDFYVGTFLFPEDY